MSLAGILTLRASTTQNYTIELVYRDTPADQSADMGKKLSGKLSIKEGSEPTLAEAILRDNTKVSERTDFSVTNTSNTTGSIYKSNKTDTGNEIYYYSGNTTNNWVKFGKFSNDYIVYRGQYSSESTGFKEYNSLNECNNANYYNYNCTAYKYANANDDMYWRIIRTNEDGSVRLLYAGTSPATTEGYMGVALYRDTDTISSRYAGYMYGGNTSLADNRANTADSTIKEYLDSWYETNLLSNYDKYISKSAIYCNDRSVGEGTWADSGSVFRFGAYTRLYTNKAPTYKCGGNTTGGLFETTQAVQDKFSVSTIEGGNGQLTYPIALMTADEISFAGGLLGSTLSNTYPWYYLNSAGGSIIGSKNCWTMTPFAWLIGGGTIVFAVNNSGMLDYKTLANSFPFRGVISMDKCAKVTGTGTATDPYVIDETNSTCE